MPFYYGIKAENHPFDIFEDQPVYEVLIATELPSEHEQIAYVCSAFEVTYFGGAAAQSFGVVDNGPAHLRVRNPRNREQTGFLEFQARVAPLDRDVDNWRHHIAISWEELLKYFEVDYLHNGNLLSLKRLQPAALGPHEKTCFEY